jgi:hypothetical protein
MAFCGTLYFFLMHNATKIRLSIPFLGIARPQSQFPHSCVCERFIYSQDRGPHIWLQQNTVNKLILEIYKSFTDI